MPDMGAQSDVHELVLLYFNHLVIFHHLWRKAKLQVAGSALNPPNVSGLIE